jgi:hypothetical protein
MFDNLIHVLINICFISTDSYYYMCITTIIYCHLSLHAIKGGTMKIHMDYGCFLYFMCF